jgi:aryl sulfotransferase
MATAPVRYRTQHADSARWTGFAFRPGDIVISTRSRSGTTWMQMICALLIFRTPDLPAPLSELSPWLDWLTIPQADLYATLSAQRHRRFIKTHTPLDGIPVDARVTYIVVARHPLDMAVSLYHHHANLNVRRISDLEGQPDPGMLAPLAPLHDWLVKWISDDCAPHQRPDSLPGVVRHLRDAWSRRAEPNVLLVHYDDLFADLEGEMRRIADRLAIEVPDDENWPELVQAATFAAMRSRADYLAQGPSGILKDGAAFFRRGQSGSAHAVLTEEERARYRARIASMVPPDLLAWLHHD